MKLGLENKKQTMWAAILGGIAVLVLAYELIPFFMGPSAPTSSAQAAAPSLSSTRQSGRAGAKSGKKPKGENLDPTLRLDLLASSEQTKYEGNGRNIFVSQREVDKISVTRSSLRRRPRARGRDPATCRAARL